jgi:hypothetical protein
MIAGASAEGADANPVVSRAVATATVGPFLVAAMGFAALLAAAGLLTLRSGRAEVPWLSCQGSPHYISSARSSELTAGQNLYALSFC